MRLIPNEEVIVPAPIMDLMMEEENSPTLVEITDHTRQDIADTICIGVHTSLRKYCESIDSNAAWEAINGMSDEEWNYVGEVVADAIINLLTR